MKKSLIIGIIVTILAILFGMYTILNNGWLGQKISHVKSATIGLDRKIDVITMDGKVVRSYTTRTQIEYPNAGTTRILTNDGKTVNISGALGVISEEQ